MTRRLLFGLGTALVLYVLFTRVIPPPASVHFTNQSCRKCHGNRKISNHTNEFQERTHGALARMEGAACLSCHSRTSCEDCHQDPDHQPDWHDSEAFRNPGQEDASWREHARLAREHRSSCATCHSQRQLSCLACHGAGAGAGEY